jgi:hypothetical protein
LDAQKENIERNKGRKLLAVKKEDGSYGFPQKAEVAYLKAEHPGKVEEISLHDWKEKYYKPWCAGNLD